MKLVLNRKLLSQFDWGLLGALSLIPFVGLIVLYSAGYVPESKGVTVPILGITLHSIAFTRQLLFLSIGYVVLMVAIAMPQTLLTRLGYPVYVAGIIVLISVLLFGTVTNGARRWIDLGFIRLQPAEFMKLALILALSRYISRNPPQGGGYTLLQLIPLALFVGVPMALIAKQPDLGTALALGSIGGAMILFAGIRARTLVALALAVAVILPVGWHFLHDYQRKRVLVLFDAEMDPLGSGYHIIQSKIAVGSGGISGKGYLQGSQAQLEFLPEHTTDFIFSALAEEWGFLGSVCVLLLYVLLLYRLLKVVSRGKNLYACLLAFGVTSMIFFHTVINIGMVVGIFPVVGIPLPLFSYGGSSVLSTMCALGLALGVSMRKYVFASRV